MHNGKGAAGDPTLTKLLTRSLAAHIISRVDIAGHDIERIFVAKEEPEAWLPLTPAMFHILLALADKDRHGYEIMREVEERSAGEVRVGPGTLYGSIKRMLNDELIE